ncbi:hypothetical protein AB1N83_008260 [Pleurotus pulmonarius]
MSRSRVQYGARMELVGKWARHPTCFATELGNKKLESLIYILWKMGVHRVAAREPSSSAVARSRAEFHTDRVMRPCINAAPSRSTGRTRVGRGSRPQLSAAALLVGGSDDTLASMGTRGSGTWNHVLTYVASNPNASSLTTGLG